MKLFNPFKIGLCSAFVFSLFSSNLLALQIDNGEATTVQGYWAVDITDGGESRTVFLTGTGTPSGTVFENIEIVFDYFSYVDTGSGGVRLSSTTITSPTASSGANETTSAGTFLGSAGNTIEWTMVSSIAAGSSVMVNELSLVARTGSLGLIDFYQYLDEDVLGNGDDFFITRGVSGLDLELFTVDNGETIGVSHSGDQSGAGDAAFSGWAACIYDNIRPAISSGTQAVSLAGEICGTLDGIAGVHPEVGAGYGPADIVSVLTWNVTSTATSATIVTTLGGVPDAGGIGGAQPTEPAIPVPTLNAWVLGLLASLFGLIAIVALRRRNPTIG